MAATKFGAENAASLRDASLASIVAKILKE